MKRSRLFAYMSLVLTFGIVVAAILGPLATGVIEFRLPENLVNQYIGGEVATLFVVAPMLMTAAILWLRNHHLAAVLAFGPALYSVYTFITAIAGQEYRSYEGNAERAFPLYAGIIALGLAIAAFSAAELLRHPAPALPDRLRRVTAGLFLAVVVFFALSWSSQIAKVYMGDPSAEYVEGPTLFWLIKLMDLAFLLPAFAVVGVGVLRGNGPITKIAYGMVSYALCMSGAILGMAIAMWLKDDPSASVSMIAFLTPVTGGIAIIAARLVAIYRQGRTDESKQLAIETSAPLGHVHAG